jgi:hypothetical protein
MTAGARMSRLCCRVMARGFSCACLSATCGTGARPHCSRQNSVTLIDPVEDQVRLHPLDNRSARQVTVIGSRIIEERQRLLDRHMSWYSGGLECLPAEVVGASERTGQRLDVVEPPESGLPLRVSPDGWPSGTQSPRSRAPPAHQSQTRARIRGHRNKLLRVVTTLVARRNPSPNPRA